MRPAASPASSRPAAVSSAACMRLYVVVTSRCRGMSRRNVPVRCPCSIGDCTRRRDPVVDAADALGREFPLCGQQDVAELVDELPRRRDQPGQRVGRVAGGVGGVQDLVALLHRPDQDGVGQVGAGLEVAVEGGPADARGLRLWRQSWRAGSCPAGSCRQGRGTGEGMPAVFLAADVNGGVICWSVETCGATAAAVLGSSCRCASAPGTARPVVMTSAATFNPATALVTGSALSKHSGRTAWCTAA
jgi:hypothetical protein